MDKGPGVFCEARKTHARGIDNELRTQLHGELIGNGVLRDILPLLTNMDKGDFYGELQSCIFSTHRVISQASIYSTLWDPY